MSTEHVAKERPTRNFLRTPSFWLAIVAVASLFVGTLGAVLTYLALQQPEPGVAFETIGETNVLDLRRPLQDLNIVFRGQNVQEQNLNLRILTISVANIGDVDILPSHYDQDDDWGMAFTNGKVIEVRLVDANSDYLRSKLVPQYISAETVIFPKVIFEKDAFFVVEVLLLHSKNDSPSFSSIGKIAGIDKVTVLPRSLGRQEVSFAKELLQGSLLIQLTRVIIYFVGSIVVLVGIVFALIGIGEGVNKVTRRRRRRRVRQAQTIRQIEQEDIKDFLISRYAANGDAWLERLQRVLKEPERVKWVESSGHWSLRGLHTPDKVFTADLLAHREFVMFGALHDLEAMTSIGLLTRGEGDSPVIDPRFGEVLDSLLAELGH